MPATYGYRVHRHDDMSEEGGKVAVAHSGTASDRMLGAT